MDLEKQLRRLLISCRKDTVQLQVMIEVLRFYGTFPKLLSEAGNKLQSALSKAPHEAAEEAAMISLLISSMLEMKFGNDRSVDLDTVKAALWSFGEISAHSVENIKKSKKGPNSN